MVADIYNGGRYLRRWALVGGWPRCPETALYLPEADEAGIAAAMAVNRVVLATAAAAAAYEGAAGLLTGPAPDQWVFVPGGDGVAVPVEDPAWTAWAAAQALVSGVGEQLLHLVRTRGGMLAEGDAGYELALPQMPEFDPREETVDLIDGAWVVRALTEEELAWHPLRPAASMPKMAFGKLVRATLGTYGDSILGMFAGVLALASGVDWADVFGDIDGDPAQPGYAKQLLAAEAVSAGQVEALRAGWARACSA